MKRLAALVFVAAALLAADKKKDDTPPAIPDSLQLAYMREIAIFAQIDAQLAEAKSAREKALEEQLRQQDGKVKAAMDAAAAACAPAHVIDQAQLQRGVMACMAKPAVKKDSEK